jgi:exopolysaccharide biosynthesis WecB/TagA/CpsF family protein
MKIIKSKKGLFDLLEKNQRVMVSFVNLYSFGQIIKLNNGADILYAGDGFLLNSLLNITFFNKVERVSFDFTSIASDIIATAAKDGRKIIFIGGKASEAEVFENKIKDKFPDLIVECRHGYIFGEGYDSVLEEISESGAGYIVAGMGGGLQEKFIGDLSAKGFMGNLFTCGGFITQTSMSETEVYYPKWVNKLNLRAFYRMYKEPHTIKRYCLDYPKNALLLLKVALFDRKKIEFL